MTQFFSYPWILSGSLVLLLLYWRYRQRYAYLWLRLLALLALLIALATPQIPLRNHELAILLDSSASVGASAEDALARLNFAPSIKPRYYYFASDTLSSNTVQQDAKLNYSLNRNDTNIARAIHVARANGAGRILLISDGIASQGNAELAVSETVPVDTLALDSRQNIRLSQLYLPDSAVAEQMVEAVAILESNSPADIILHAEVAGELLEPIPYRLEAGDNAIPFRFLSSDASSMNVNVWLESSLEQPQNDDRQQAILNITSSQSVLVIGDPFLHAMLQQQGISSTLAEPSALTGNLEYSAIVIRASSGVFSQGQLELLERYVLEGGGLLMTGGNDAFGLGGWYRTPVEAVLPVHTDLRNDVTLPLVALVMIIDQSNSMGTGRPAKIELAKEGAIRVIELAYQQDRLGLMTFSDKYRWVFEPRRSSRAAKEAMINAVLEVDVEGGTVLTPAYQEAISTLEATEAAIKHIIILSDGQLNDNPFASANNDGALSDLAQEAQEAGITTSSIAVGSNADFARLEHIAEQGGGRYYAALDATTLPRIFTSEALTATRAMLREGDIQAQVYAHPLLNNQSAPPALDAYISTRLKAQSEILLQGLDDEPILALSRQGLGRSAALTTDLNQWAGDFATWQGLPQLMSSVVRWLQANPNDYTSSLQAREDGSVLLRLDAVRDGAYVEGEKLSVRYQGREMALEQRSFGRYEAVLPRGSNNQNDEVVILQNDTIISRSRLPLSTGEFAQQGGRTLLAKLSAISGGAVLEAGTNYNPAGLWQRRSLRLPFILLALSCVLLELSLRRFGHGFLASLWRKNN